MNPSDGAVDVVMVTWNTRELSLSCLTNLMRSTPERDLRVLVHDNASSDGTAAAITEHFPTIDVECETDNIGFAAGVNQALKRSSAPWVLLLNSDAWPEPGAIDAMVDCAARHPQAAAIAAKLLRPDGELELSAWPLPSLRVAAASARRPDRFAWPHDEERKVGWAVGAALLIRRTALEAIGPLDDALFMYAEDLDWCWRAADAGWEIWFTPNAVVRHVGNASGAQRYGEGRSAAWINNSIRVYRRRHSAPNTVAWQAANAVGATLARRRAIRTGNRDLANLWRAQTRQWLHAPHDDRDQRFA